VGTSISYWTTDAVDPNVRAAVMAEARHLESRRWWGEPICFFDWEGKEHQLAGDTKPFGSIRLRSDGTEVDLAASGDEEEFELDWFMAYREMKIICEQLARWSATHGLTFEVSLSGAPLGVVTRGDAAEVLAALREMSGDFKVAWGVDDAADAMREEQAWRRYPERAAPAR
jgi:hypothetical protein